MRLMFFRLAVVGLIVGGGCSTSEQATTANPPPNFSGIELTVAAFEDGSLIPAINAQRGEWGAIRKTKANIKPEAVTASSLEGVDVIVFPGDRLGELMDIGALVTLPESLVRPALPTELQTKLDPNANPTLPDDPLKFADVLPGFKDQVSKYGSDRMALPLGTTGLVLAMNQTILERAKVDLKGPKSWKELDALAKLLHSGETAGIAVVLGADTEGMGDALFLARAASLGQHKDQFSFLFDADSMTPRIASPPFREALESLIALAKFGPEGASNLDPDKARAAFREGKAALLIDRAERADTWVGGFSVVVAPLPGSERVFDPTAKLWEDVKPWNRPTYLPSGGGWMVGVLASTSGKRREAALDFAVYLATPEIAVRVRTTKDRLMLPVRSSQLSQGLLDPKASTGVDGRAWSEAVASTLTATRVIPGLRIPDSSGYLADLTKARVAAASGEPAEAALKNAAKDWDERTVRLGKERQLWHYRRSLNTLATKPQPPERSPRTP